MAGWWNMDKVWVGCNPMTLIVVVPHLLDLIPWTLGWEFMVVPQCKNVISRGYHGGAFGQDVIPRRLRGGASLLGRYSTGLVMVPHYTYLDSQVLES